MHDGSHRTLLKVVEFYNEGGSANPHLSPKMKPLELTKDEMAAIVAMLEALDGRGYEDKAPTAFPQ